MAVTLADRLKKHDRDRARLSEREAETKELARKARNRQLYSAGGLVAKCGLLELDEATLYGALLTLESGGRDPKVVERWKKSGEAALAHDEAERQKVRVPLMIVYPGPVTPITAAALRNAGLKYSKAIGRWIGRTDAAEAHLLAEAHNGRVEFVTETSEEEQPLAAE